MPLADLWHRVAFHGAIHGVTGAMRCASYEETTLEFHLSYDDSFQKSESVKLYWMMLLMVIGIPLFTRFYTSQVVQDFFYQQYHLRIFQLEEPFQQETTWALLA